MAIGVIAGAFIGAMASAAVHGIRGGSGNGAFLAMLGGAASGAAGGYVGGALGGVAGGATGGGLGATVGSTGIPIATLIAAGGKIVVGAMSPDYPQKQMYPDIESTREGLKRQGINNETEYYKYLMNQDTAINRALQNVTQGTGEGGIVTIGDLMKSVDPTGLAPTEGEMTLERWQAIAPIYTEALLEKYTGFRNKGQGLKIAEAKEGLQGEYGVAPESRIPLKFDNESNKYYASSPFDFENPINKAIREAASAPGAFTFDAPITGQSTDPLEGLGELDNSNVLPSEQGASSDYYYTSPQQETDSQTQTPFSDVDTARQTARYNSFAAARAGEDALRAQSLLSTSKSLNLPRFDEEYGLASSRLSQKPKPFI